MPCSFGLGTICFLLQYYNFSFKQFRNSFNNLFKTRANEELFLIDQRQEKASLTKLKQILKHNPTQAGIVLY